jgi:Fuc2NAc and GlcNAc transferase
VTVAVLILAAAAISLLGTALLRHYALLRSVIDVPNERSSHTTPTPRGGGLAIAITFLGFLGAMWAGGWIERSVAMALTGGGLLVATVGFIDDHRHVSVKWRLSMHLVAVVWALLLLGGCPAIDFHGVSVDLGVIGNILAALYLVWLLNLFNFMDGIDGIASTEAISVAVIAATLLWYSGEDQSIVRLQLVLAGAVAGFLFLNWPPARIFMGDGGSGFLGFTLGALAWVTVARGTFTVWVWLILFATFFVDATVTLWRRWRRGQALHVAHRSHAYQRLSRRFRSHLKVTLGVLFINLLWLGPLAWLSVTTPRYGAALTLVAWTPLVIFCWWAGAGLADDAT